jgi:hypothetical protein
MRNSTETIISALRILAKYIQSEDSVANAYIGEAADRLEELEAQLKEAKEYADKLVAHKDMLCLPKDLQNLQTANSQFATENHILKEQLRMMETSKNKITWT